MKVFLVLLLLTTVSLFSQNSTKTCEILSKINVLIQREHISPKPIDDSLSVYIFDAFIDELDPARNLFLKSDYDLLSKKYRLNIDNLILVKDCSFLTEIKSVLQKSLLRNKLILEKINKEAIDYQYKDTIRLYKKAFPVYLLDDEVEKVLSKKLRYEILNEITGISKNLDSLKSNFNTLELKTKSTIIQDELCRINTVLNAKSSFEESLYNHFCNYFDPHTAYFSNDDKSTFVSSLSKEHLSMGLLVSLNEKNEIIVDEIDPNGPAFQTGKIKKGDQIISISNKSETLVVSCASLESISNMILSDTNKKIILTLKRNSGKSFEVLIEKQILKDEENTVYSFIVKKNDNIGYIKIPSFYADIEGNTGKGCAEDVATELMKLQKDNIKGLVIDLTDNGGGSMEEAVKLASMFVDYGAISVVVDKTKAQSVINDFYKGMIFKEPIVLLINSNSASASEFFATILQDHKRAVLIGSSSLGKATMQTILPLEENDNQNFVKVTINKFYRINGKSHQGLGVIPDVKLPEMYEDIFPKENNYPTAFKNDSINTIQKVRPFWKNNILKMVIKNSQDRVNSDSYFNAIKTLNKKVDLLFNQEKATIPITIDAVFEEQNNRNKVWEEINTFDKKNLNLTIYNTTINNYILSLHPLEETLNKFKIETLKSNHYLNEATAIIEDFNTLK